MKATPTQTVYKYAIAPTVEMPEGATVLKVAFDPTTGGLALWAMVDPKAKTEARFFAMAKTGETLPAEIADCPFLDTITAVVQGGDGKPKFIATHVWEVPAYLAKKAKPCTPGDEWKQG